MFELGDTGIFGQPLNAMVEPAAILWPQKTEAVSYFTTILLASDFGRWRVVEKERNLLLFLLFPQLPFGFSQLDYPVDSQEYTKHLSLANGNFR